MSKTFEYMDDSTRILMTIIRKARHDYSCLRWRNGKDVLNNLLLSFDYDNLPKPGDLVIGTSTRGVNPWVIGYLKEMHDSGRYVIREIGSDRLCDYSNETFVKINGLRKEDLWDGEKRKLYYKVTKAIGKIDDWYRYKDMDIDGNKATIALREKFEGDVIAKIDFKWNSKTSIKSIAKLLQEAIDKYEKGRK